MCQNVDYLGALRTGTAVTPTHKYLGTYHREIITCKVVRARKNCYIMIMSM